MLTTSQQHAARLRQKADDYEKLAQRYRNQLAAIDRPQLTSESGIHALIQLHERTRDSLLAGAEALEAQGRCASEARADVLTDMGNQLRAIAGDCGVEGHHQFELAAGLRSASEQCFAKAAQPPRAQGRWIMRHYHGRRYMVPSDRIKEWEAVVFNAEAGEYSAIVPEWAEPVADDVVITGWVR